MCENVPDQSKWAFPPRRRPGVTPRRLLTNWERLEATSLVSAQNARPCLVGLLWEKLWSEWLFSEGFISSAQGPPFPRSLPASLEQPSEAVLVNWLRPWGWGDGVHGRPPGPGREPCVVPARGGCGPRDSDDGHRSSSRPELRVSPGARRVESELFKYNIQKLRRPDTGTFCQQVDLKRSLAFSPSSL